MQFKISKELIEQIELLIQDNNDAELFVLLNDMHHADIAEILMNWILIMLFISLRF